MTVALFMLAAFFGLKGLGAPDWASILVSVAVGEFLWSKERKRAARENHNTWLKQMITTQTLLVEMKLNDVMARLGKLRGDVAETNHRAESQTKAHLI
jgi:hypothetical protein